MVGATKKLRTDAAVRFNGQLMPREYPFSRRPVGGKGTPISAEEFHVDPEHLKFEQLLAAAIREQSLIENILSAEKPSRDRLAKWYTDSVNALRNLQDEWQEFSRGMIQVEEDHRGRVSENSRQAHASNRDSWLRLITEDSSLRPIPLPSRLSSELLSGEEGHFKDFVLQDILAKVDVLHATILDQLRRLVELEVCGLIARYPNRVCEYHYFFRRVVSQVEYAGRDHVTQNDFEGWSQEVTTEILIGEIQITLCRRIHQVINRVEVDPANASNEIPEMPQSLLDSIPAWLRPMTRMVEGTVVSATGVDRDVERKAFSATGKQTTRKWSTVPLYYSDPALVLGQFVLTGWGPEELERNFKEKDFSKKPADVKQGTGFHLPQAVSIGMAIAGMALIASEGPAGIVGFASVLFAGLAWGCVYHTDREKFELDISRLGLGLVVSIALGLGVSAITMGSIVIGLVLAVIGVGIGLASVLSTSPPSEASKATAND